MKSFRHLVLIVLTLAAVPAALAADFGIRAGRMNESGSEFVGAELVIDLGTIHMNPNVEYRLEDDVTAGSLNLDFTLDIGSFARFQPYAGAGVGLSYFDAGATVGESTELLGNLLGGVQFELASVKPYGQIKYVRFLDDENGGDDDEIALTIGVRF